MPTQSNSWTMDQLYLGGAEDKNRTDFLNVAQGTSAIIILFVVHIETIRNLI
jgi:hypothetical protein